MKIVVAYIVVSGGSITNDYVSRFVGTYLAHPPGIDHETVIVCQGGPLPLETGLMFTPMRCSFMPRENDPGWDVSAHQDVAKQIPCDMLVCLGESVYFHRDGWLRRLEYAWNKFGPGMYGIWSSNLVRPHMNTTGFAVDPKLLLGHSTPRNRKERYEFEHGLRSFWRTANAFGRPTKLVTFDGIYDPMQWRQPKDILWRGDQSNCLAWCNHVDRFRAQTPKAKLAWARAADQPFR